jgi:hypothetical protein
VFFLASSHTKNTKSEKTNKHTIWLIFPNKSFEHMLFSKVIIIAFAHKKKYSYYTFLCKCVRCNALEAFKRVDISIEWYGSVIGHALSNFHEDDEKFYFLSKPPKITFRTPKLQTLIKPVGNIFDRRESKKHPPNWSFPTKWYPCLHISLFCYSCAVHNNLA